LTIKNVWKKKDRGRGAGGGAGGRVGAGQQEIPYMVGDTAVELLAR
jgi:hypothetical protein